jgi:hypothetical protein
MPTERPAAAVDFGLRPPTILAALQPESSPPKPGGPERNLGGRTHRPKVTSQPRASDPDSQPSHHRPSDNVAASAAAAGSSAPPTLWCVIFAACTALAALELRGFGARLLVPDAPGASFLRDRPG